MVTKRKTSEISLEEQKIIISRYLDGESQQTIADTTELSYKVVNKILKNNNIKRREQGWPVQRTINHNYFSCIDTKEKATAFGLIFSDGCNVKDRKNFVITLNTIDKDALEGLVKLFESDYKVRDFQRNKILRGKPIIEFYSRLNIYSQQMSEDLLKYGCIPRKSLVKVFPKKIEQEDLIKSFIYGYFLGNGCLCRRKKKNSYVLTINSTIDMCDNIKIVFERLNVHCTICPTKSKNMAILYVSGIFQVKKVADWLFEGEINLMNRKTNLYNELVKYHNQKYPNRVA